MDALYEEAKEYIEAKEWFSNHGDSLENFMEIDGNVCVDWTSPSYIARIQVDNAMKDHYPDGKLIVGDIVSTDGKPTIELMYVINEDTVDEHFER